MEVVEELREATWRQRTALEDALRSIDIEDGRLIEAGPTGLWAWAGHARYGATCNKSAATRRLSANSSRSTHPVANSPTANAFAPSSRARGRPPSQPDTGCCRARFESRWRLRPQ